MICNKVVCTSKNIEIENMKIRKTYFVMSFQSMSKKRNIDGFKIEKMSLTSKQPKFSKGLTKLAIIPDNKRPRMLCLKVSKSQKHFFSKLHCPKNERNIRQNSALESRIGGIGKIIAFL